ncbi:MAG: DUF1874 domain-containing protein [Fervidobacterium sp.]|nr:DUF1874 domain-containing protein [Fervidobacterium sp.]
MQHKVYLSNAFSLSMLQPDPAAVLTVRPIELNYVKDLFERCGFESAVGHQATAEVLTNLLGIEVPANRTQIKLQPGDILIVFQLSVRLQEGQILSREEVLDLYEKRQASFMLVTVEQSEV